MRRRLNRKLFLILLLAGSAAGLGIHLVHSSQLGHTTQFLRDQATAALESQDYEEAQQYLARYLALQPEDAEALEEYGNALRRLGHVERALRAFQQAVRLDPTRRGAQRQIVDLALQARQYATAAAHARALLSDGTGRAADHGALERAMGQCHEARRRYAEAAEAYARAAGHAPRLVDVYVRWAVLLRERLKQPEQADAVMVELVRRNPDSFRAHFERARYRRKWQQGGADADLSRARTLAQNASLATADDFLVASELARADGDQAEARRYLTRAATRFPTDRTFHERAARLELLAGRPEQAIAALKRGLVALPGDRELRVSLVEAYLAAGQVDTARKELDSLRGGRSVAQVWLDYLDAQLLMRDGRWAEAGPLLESVRERLGRRPDVRAEADHLLSQCYENLGDRSLYFTTLQRALTDATQAGVSAGRAQFRLGSAFLAAGRADEAFALLTQATQAADAPPQAWAVLAAAALARAARLPPAQRAPLWPEIEQHVAEAEQRMPGAPEVALVRADVLSARGELEAAEAHLRAVRDQQPHALKLWTGLVALLVRHGRAPDTLRGVLDHAQRKLGDTADVRLLRAYVYANRPTAEARAALASLVRDLDSLPADARSRLLAGLAEAHERVGDAARAEQFWRQYLELQPGDLRVRQLLFEAALQTGDEAAIEKTLAELKEAEGDHGLYWRVCAATRLLARGDGDTTAAAETRQLLEEVRARRPHWARLAALEGDLAEREGNLEEAAVKYQLAVSQGERSPRVMQRTFDLLARTRQYGVADQLIARLGESAGLGDALRWLTAGEALRSQDYERAEVVARAAVLARPQDHQQHLWLGAVLAAAGKPDAAERALVRATELAGHVPETWIALVQHQVRRDTAKAEATLEQARAAVPAEILPLTLGPCYELLGRRAEAEEQYQAALAARPDDPGLLRVLALHYLVAGATEKADALLARLLDPAAKVPEIFRAWARRSRAVSLANSTYPRFKEGLRLLDENVRRIGVVPDDRRARAVLLNRPGHRDEAIALMEEMIRTGSPSSADQFLLAQLYEAAGDWARAEPLLAAVTAPGTNPTYLAHYARALLTQGDPAKARTVVERLENLEPKALTTLELKVRLLAADGQADQAAPLVEALVQEVKDPTVIGTVAALMENIGQAEVAERLYVRAVERKQRPGSALRLAQFLGRQGRVAEALDLCEQSAEQLPPEVVAGVVAGAVRTGKGDQEQGMRAERWLTAALDASRKRNAPNSPALLTPLADLLDYQGRFDAAIKVYRQLLAHNADDVVAANNLAWLLAMTDRKKAAEGLALITRAIDELMGPVPSLLDTRATVSVALGRPTEAIQDLETALGEGQSALRYMHLALAYHAAGKRQEAREALDAARSLGFEPASLHPLERPPYQRLAAELGIE